MKAIVTRQSPRHTVKAVIMAGGKATRLAEVTKNEIPKAMVAVSGKPIIQHQIERLKENGVKEITLVVGFLKEKLIEFLGDGKKFGVKIDYIIESEPLGTAGALFYLKDRMKDDFLLLFGDVIFNIDIKRMVKFHKDKDAIMTLYTHPNNHPYDSDLIVYDDNCHVTKLIKKKIDTRPEFYHNCVNASFTVVSPKALEVIKTPEPIDLEKDLIRGMLLPQKKTVCAYFATEYIKDVGTPERIKCAEEDIANGIVKMRNLKNKQKAIFLDRDGTINVYDNFISSPDQIKLIDGAAEAIKLINKSGYLAIVITNQAVIARGECSHETLHTIHNKIETLLATENGAFIDDLFYCPHHPDKGFEGEVKELKINCNCRKPKTGMFKAAQAKFNINLKKSWMIGDTFTDIEAGKRAGTKTIKLPSAAAEKQNGPKPDYVAKNLLKAIELILKRNH